MFTVRYELDLYILFRRNSVLKGLYTEDSHVNKKIWIYVWKTSNPLFFPAIACHFKMSTDKR
jgi:hypothetical protein